MAFATAAVVLFDAAAAVVATVVVAAVDIVPGVTRGIRCGETTHSTLH